MINIKAKLKYYNSSQPLNTKSRSTPTSFTSYQNISTHYYQSYTGHSTNLETSNMQ